MRTFILATLALVATPAFCASGAAAQSNLQARQPIVFTPEELAILHAPMIARNDIADIAFLEKRHKHHNHHGQGGPHHDHHGYHDHKREVNPEMLAARSTSAQHAYKRDELVNLIARTLEEFDRRELHREGHGDPGPRGLHPGRDSVIGPKWTPGR
ncbi:hypothetical protein EIP91_011957 [Steccherinum ochraceum]|uniref:Uncharacterized protein n=1 Tax=Steccherinum ochraceum TaxID=92696 RepID=A0A4R0RHG4_9APHY|nr:hypothetical protein EIP91_011957 [Steccherinum ochraceum]